MNDVLIIGFGSIGAKHASIQKKLNKNVYVFSKNRNHEYNIISDLNEIKEKNISLIFICNKTNFHFMTLNKIKKYLEADKKLICLIEKPLFHQKKLFKFNLKNIYVAYNLRFHPLIIELKKIIQNKKLYHVSFRCFSYLPYWRKTSYKNSYSANKNEGGGVHKDLSHEIDLLVYLFGKVKNFKSILKNTSNLEINSKDILLLIGSTKLINFSINLTYFSLIEERSIFIDGENFSVFLDLISNRLIYKNKYKEDKIKAKNGMQQSFDNMHLNLNLNNYDDFCSLKDGLYINDFINNL